MCTWYLDHVHTCMHAWIHTCYMHTCIHATYIHAYTYKHIQIWIHRCVHACVRTCYIHTCTHIYTYRHEYMRTHVNTFTHANMNTYIHTNLPCKFDGPIWKQWRACPQARQPATGAWVPCGNQAWEHEHVCMWVYILYTYIYIYIYIHAYIHERSCIHCVHVIAVHITNVLTCILSIRPEMFSRVFWVLGLKCSHAHSEY
jgi:hypothetical protein